MGVKRRLQYLTVGCFDISHFLCELPSCWSVRLSLESPFFQAFFFIMEPQANRFAGVYDSDVDQVIASRVPQATKEATSGCLRVFHQFADKQETRLNYQTCDKAEFCFLLSQLYIGARRHDGAVYQRSSMLCLRLKRHFMDECQWDIINEVEFARANNALDGILKKHKRDGELKAVSHKPVITEEDFEKMMDIFLRNKEPEMLVMQVWFFVTFHFGLRGRELQ